MAREMDYFRSFCRVAKALNTSRSQADLLDLIVASACESMAAKAACLFLSDVEQDVFVPVSAAGLSAEYLKLRPHAAKRLVDESLRAGFLAIPDATTDTRVEMRAEKKREGIASMLLVPVLVQDDPIGVLVLYTASPREFSREDIDFLTALAEQGGLAIGRTRLMERIRDYTRLFLDLAGDINSSLDIKTILDHLTREMCDKLGLKGVILRLLDRETEELTYVTSYGLSEQFLNKGPVFARSAEELAMNGETVIIEDVAADSRIQYPQEVAAEGIRSMMLAPIRAKDEVLGLMRVCSSQPFAYLEETRMLVDALAQTGGLAIQNASQYLELQQDMQELEQDVKTERSWF